MYHMETKYYAVGKIEDNGTLSVVYATGSGTECVLVIMSKRSLGQKNQAVQQNLACFCQLLMKNVYDNYGWYPSQAIPATTYGATANIVRSKPTLFFPLLTETCCPYDILPNGPKYAV